MNWRCKLVVPNEERLKALMLAALDGDSTSYRTLLNDLSRILKSYFLRRLFGGNSTTAEDLTQDTLLVIHTKRITYDPDMALLPWVHGIARHKLIDHLRRHGRHVMTALEEDFPSADEADATDARLDMERLLDEMPERTAKLIRTVKIEGQSIDDAARANGMSQSAVKVAIHRGLATLTQRFSGKKHE